jgi:PAS domain S-box-containing protein
MPMNPTRNAAGPAVDPSQSGSHTHSVQFYSDDKFLIDCLGRFIGSALGAGDAGIVIATEEHRRQLVDRLTARGLNMQLAAAEGRYVAVDARETMSQFMRDGRPDEQRFREIVSDVIDRAKAAAHRDHGKAALFGEMVALLWEQGNSEAALRVEQLWNEIAQTHSFSLVCAYPLRDFYREEDKAAFLRICDEHASVIPAESYMLATEDERERMIAQWQQQAQSFEALSQGRADGQLAAARLAAIVESSEDAIASKDLNGIVTSWNAAAERMFGWKAHEMIGKSILTVIPPELHGDEDMILGRIRRGIPIDHFETVRVTKDGKRINVSLTVSPVKDEQGRIIGAAKIARDITAQKLAEERLRRAEKLAATGRMAATIAHEINNPLEAVTNLLYLLRPEVSEPQGRAHLALAESELARVAQITKQTLAFHRENVRPEPVALNELMESITAMFARKAAVKKIAVSTDFQPCTIPGMRGQLRQLFSNLSDNAVDAAPLEGKVRIEVRCDGGNAAVSVSDNGDGICPDDLPRLFEPFFTTKQVGTGLGLWVAREVAEKHGGEITVESKTGADHGTTFHVRLSANGAESTSIHTAA